jgi:transposase
MFIMGSRRREFSAEFKDEAVRLVINTGRPVAVVARELGVVEQTLGNWVKAYRVRAQAGDGALSETERAELARLRKENSELRMDRAFLKKASLFFAQEASDTNEKRSL